MPMHTVRLLRLRLMFPRAELVLPRTFQRQLRSYCSRFDVCGAVCAVFFFVFFPFLPFAVCPCRRLLQLRLELVRRRRLHFINHSPHVCARGNYEYSWALRHPAPHRHRRSTRTCGEGCLSKQSGAKPKNALGVLFGRCR